MKGPIKKLPPFPETNPELLDEWDYEKNAGIDPYSLSACSIKKVWWKCSKNPLHYDWEAIICNRARKGHGCLNCAGHRTIPAESFAVLRPEIMKEWNYERNKGIDPLSLSLGSQTRVWWRCSEGHEWDTFLRARAKDDKGCLWCTGRVASEKKKETLQHFYEWFSESLEDVQSLFRDFVKRIKLIDQLNSFFKEQSISTTNFWNEVRYWAFAIMEREGLDAESLIAEDKKHELLNLCRDNEKAYAPMSLMRNAVI